MITSTLTFAATANAITYVGAAPVFIDSDRATWNMDPELLAEELERLRQGGQAAEGRDRRSISTGSAPITGRSVAACATLRRARHRGRRRGARRDLRRPAGGHASARSAVFSFNGNKIITTSGGGMLVSDDEGARPTRALPRHAGPRPGAALPALADRLQLPA